MRLHDRISAFLRCDSGLAATEYAFMLAMIAAGIIASMESFGDVVMGLYVVIRGAL